MLGATGERTGVHAVAFGTQSLEPEESEVFYHHPFLLCMEVDLYGEKRIWGVLQAGQSGTANHINRIKWTTPLDVYVKIFCFIFSLSLSV